MGIILLILAILLFSILAPIGFLWGVIEAFWKRGFKAGFKKMNRYFKDSAVSIDQTANVLCRELFNDTLINKKGYEFGNPDETISGVLGKNKVKGTLTKIGSFLDYLLDKLDPNHSINSIEEDEKHK